MSLVFAVADAVAAELAAAPGGTFSLPFTPQRRVLPRFDLQDLGDLTVSVVPRSVAITGGTRALNQYEVAVDVGVQCKLAGDVDAEVAQLSELVEQIADHLRRRPLASMPGVAWVGIANDPVYAPEHLAENRVFTSVLTVTYRAMK